MRILSERPFSSMQLLSCPSRGPLPIHQYSMSDLLFKTSSITFTAKTGFFASATLPTVPTTYFLVTFSLALTASRLALSNFKTSVSMMFGMTVKSLSPNIAFPATEEHAV